MKFFNKNCDNFRPHRYNHISLISEQLKLRSTPPSLDVRDVCSFINIKRRIIVPHSSAAANREMKEENKSSECQKNELAANY